MLDTRRLSLTALLLAALAAVAFCRLGDCREPTREQIDFFERKVRPVLVERCQKCHGPKTQKANLRLDSAAAVLRGGDSGPVIDPGRPGSLRRDSDKAH